MLCGRGRERLGHHMDSAKGKSRLLGAGRKMWGEGRKIVENNKAGRCSNSEIMLNHRREKPFFSGCFGAFSGLGMTCRSS